MKRKPIKVHIMDREYTLRVDPQNEENTRELAAAVDRKMQAFRRAHPNQVELTTAIITALALAEELQATRAERGPAGDKVEDTNETLKDLAQQLQDVVEEQREDAPSR